MSLEEIRKVREGSKATDVYRALEEIGSDRMFRFQELKDRSGAPEGSVRAVLHQLIEHEQIRVREEEDSPLNWYWYAGASAYRKKLLTRRWDANILA